MRKAAVFRFYNSRYGSAKTGKVITPAVKYHNILLAQTSSIAVALATAQSSALHMKICSAQSTAIFDRRSNNFPKPCKYSRTILE